MKLVDVGIGETVKVSNNAARDYLRERLLSLGLTRGADVEVLRKGPKDNLTVYRIRGAMIALRREEAHLIDVRR